MKLLPLIWRNALRNRLRTGLTVAGIALLLFVIIFVVTALTEIQAWEGESEGKLRVVVQHSTGLAEILPIRLQDYLESPTITAHSKGVMKFNWFGGYWKDPANLFAQFAVDHLVWPRLMPEYRFSPGAIEALGAGKTATVVGERLMRRFGWKVATISNSGLMG